MGAINVLPKNIAELIAAGEVIERPSSVIKELVENSIDAGAHSVTVEIQNGGTTYMRVTDDGCGIEREDVRNAFLRHATSKIAEKDDLDAIDTLGFRGEALASICAVSKVELLTKSDKEEDGTRYALEGGEETAFELVGCPQGTTFIVRDIFYNVPARMKFLKKDVSEGNAVSVLLDRIALSHPEISFTMIRDGKQTLKTQGSGKLDDAVYQVFGRDFFNSLVSVSYAQNNIRIRGFVTKPTASVKANRSMQMFYINGRYVRSKTAMAALDQAYKGSIMVGKYPSCVLLLDMNCSMLDVNVHPAKLEVRFTNERPVYECVYHGVRSAVMNYDTRDADPTEQAIRITSPQLLASPSDKATQLGFSYGSQKSQIAVEAAQSYSNLPSALDFRPSRLNQEKTEEEPEISVPPSYSEKSSMVLIDDPLRKPQRSEVVQSDLSKLFGSFTEKQEEQTPSDEDEQIVLNLSAKPSEKEETTTPENHISKEEVTIVDDEERETPVRFIGQAFSTYIILEYGSDRLMFIDKHAAHERLIYEKLKKRKAGTDAQLLLEPVSITLEKEEARVVLENKEMLMEAGFDVDSFGERTIIIRSVPIMMETLDITESFSEIAEYLCKHKKLILSEKMEWIYANTACRAAVKGGNKNGPEELVDLALTLERNPEIRYCPHGRPIYFFMTKYEIEKLFGRIQ
ncbi:MAG: DNA mismatch repair endonuclease MutL [Clostridia bacterium]|nr:DNA mismatch repair endonuclease MutL [Clostridia bacterium]